jgi:gliding motility-associated-like protein
MEGYLVADTSFVRVPNVFTPNGDGANDDFVVSYWSLQSINIQVFNRWGKKVHSWENNNIRGFDNTVSESVWDGKIGGRYASPGVYYYVVEARGRDDKKRYAHGFVHLFRDK